MVNVAEKWLSYRAKRTGTFVAVVGDRAIVKTFNLPAARVTLTSRYPMDTKDPSRAIFEVKNEKC